MPVTSYSTTAASNNGAVPNGAPEGMAPSSVNDVIRQIMADVALESQINNVKVLKSVAGTNTITADMDPELGAYSAGQLVIFTPANTNTGAATLAIDGLAALDILKPSGDPLQAGDLLIGLPALLILDSGADDFILMNPQTSDGIRGSFTGTYTGMTGAVTASISYILKPNEVTLYVRDASGTSNSTAMTLTGIPAALQGTLGAPQSFSIPVVTDNGASVTSGVYVTLSSAQTVLTFSMNGSSTGFTNSGTKGMPVPFTITYKLN